jgi:hypothetical protein
VFLRALELVDIDLSKIALSHQHFEGFIRFEIAFRMENEHGRYNIHPLHISCFLISQAIMQQCLFKSLEVNLVLESEIFWLGSFQILLYL